VRTRDGKWIVILFTILSSRRSCSLWHLIFVSNICAGRVGSIRLIINALIASLGPVMNAFIIMFVVLLLYAIIGVSFYAETAPESFGNLSR
jgi:hypothetical protein